MILGTENSEIVKLAVAGQSYMTDGCALYDADNGKMVTGSYTTGTIENPANHLVEVFRLHQGESGEIDHNCDDCPFRNGFVDEEEKSLYPATREDCCIDAYVDNDFEDDIEDNIESIERQVRDLLNEHLYDDIQKLNEIRISISDLIHPEAYLSVRQDDWEMRVLDSYVDSAMEDGFELSIEAKDYLDAEVQYIVNICEYSDNEQLFEVRNLVLDFKLDKAIEVLQ